MTNLFKKAAVMTDLHIGLKSNSIVHNEDCLNFVKWFIETAKKENCDVAVICGDWHNHRASINVHSLHYSMKCLELLNSAFAQVYFITGNHDLYYREKRDIHSVAWADYLPNVSVINDIFTDGDVTFCPWLVGDEIQRVKKIKTKYTFGHFELGSFYMNAQVLMPDHDGSLKVDDFSNTEKVFSGHFHKRQSRKNIWYIGNAFPHNYADAGDDARGMMILEWGNEPEFHSWPRQPVFRVHKLSEILEKPEGYLLIDSHVRVHLDIDISYEEANFLRETFIPEYKLREMTLIPMKGEQTETQGSDGLRFESVDQIIIDQINAIESKSFDKKLLLDIYNNL
jgi:predicted phosphodiesterase